MDSPPALLQTSSEELAPSACSDGHFRLHLYSSSMWPALIQRTRSTVAVRPRPRAESSTVWPTRDKVHDAWHENVRMTPPPSEPRRTGRELAQRSTRGARAERRTVIYEVQATGWAGGLAGALLVVLALLALLGLLALGVLTLTVALWLACAAVLVALAAALLGRGRRGC